MRKDINKEEIKVNIYEYKLTNESIVKSRHVARIQQRNSGIIYIIRKNKSYKHIFDSNLDKNRLNTIYSLTDDFDKYSKIILNDYIAKNEKMRKELEEREKVLERLLENMGKMG